MADITMPQLGETVTEGTITRWAKKVGDHVDEDEVLFEVSTDKVDSEVPSPVSGVVAEILVQEGETADVGAKLAVISDGDAGSGGGQAEASAAAPSGNGAAPPAEAEAEAEGETGETAEAEPQPEPEPAQPEEPAAPAADTAADMEAAEPAGQSPATNGDSPAPAPAPAEADAGGDGGGDGDAQARVLSPVVRRLLKEHNLDPSEVKATGAGGRITRADVLAVVDSRSAGGGPRQAPAPSPAPAPAAAKAEPAPVAEAPAAPRTERDERVPFSNIRRRTAEHMRRSLDTSAHTLVAIEVDYEAVEKARLPARSRFKEEEGISLSYLPFMGRAVVDALHDFPKLNASMGENELIVHHAVNLGIAVDMSHEGLIVPVVHDAQDKRLRALAREIADLANRARAKKLSADDISGGTFTITNPGGYGTFLTAPIINQPQVAILSTDGVKPKPVAVALPSGGYGVAVHPVGNLAISFDHRAVDGAYASAFLARLREIVETRDWGQELA